MNGPVPELLDRRLLLFTGKGGVGKSTMAAATALLASRIGKRVLLVEVDAKGDIPAQFEHSPVGFTPREIHPGVLAMAMDTEASLQEYLRLNLRVPVIGRIGPLARVLDFVATAAPGVKEILTIGKIVSIAYGCDPSGLLANTVSEKAGKLVGATPVDVKGKVEAKK